MENENTANNVVDFTYYKLMRMLEDVYQGDEQELLMQLIEGYMENSVGVVWVGGEPRFYDLEDNPEECTSLKEILELEDELLENYLDGDFDEYVQEAIEELGLREESLED